MSYLVYPGATHKRFEHSLGVMELAGRVFDVVTADHNLHESVASVVRQIPRDERSYWRKVLRMAALCHDIGHLPFSHAAEHELLPNGWNHEKLTAQLVLGDSMREIWESMRPPINPRDVAKVAVGPKEMPEDEFSNWEALLAEIISGEAFGVDRMDYLLRDSHHAGVAYGRFDHFRLIDTMRILPASQESDEPMLGIEEGGIHSTEALLLARYFMFMQVYHHRVRAAYDIHLKEFLAEWLPQGQFPTTEAELRHLTDNEALQAISIASEDPSVAGHEHAARIVERRHYRPLYTTTLSDREKYDDPLTTIFKECIGQFGEDAVRKVSYAQSEVGATFPVIDTRGRIVSADTLSSPLSSIPTVDVGIVLMDPALVLNARNWLDKNKEEILDASLKGV